MEKKDNKKIKNLYYTIGANLLTFIIGVVTGFILPKFMTIDDYAYIKLFGFYLTYVGVTHFGFLDGIYIKYGAYEYEDLPKKKFRGYLRYLIALQLIEVAILILGINIFVENVDRGNIIYGVLFNMVIMNITQLFIFIHQFTKRFKLFSINLVLSKLMYVVLSLVLLSINIRGYMPFVILQTIINVIILGIYIFKNYELVFGSYDPILVNIKECIKLTKSGLFIMIGNFMGVIILGIDRIFVDRMFSLQDFAMYSFTYTLISLFFILLNSLTTVIYPYLARLDKDNFKVVYENMRVALSGVIGITLLGYFVIKAIVINFLPEYTGSLNILIFLVPTVLYSGQINILIANYYKVLRLNKDYTKNNIIALLMGILTNIIAIIIFKDVISIAMATLISFILWLLYSDNYFKKKIKIKYSKAMILDFIIIGIFIFSATQFSWITGGVIYGSVLLIVLLIGYKNNFKKVGELLLKK